MTRKLVLCASSLHLTAGVWTGRRLGSVRSFEDTEEDQQAFANFLRAAPGQVFGATRPRIAPRNASIECQELT